MVQNAIFRGKRHDNKILKVKILLSRNFVVMAQAPYLSAALEKKTRKEKQKTGKDGQGRAPISWKQDQQDLTLPDWKVWAREKKGT